MKRPLRRPTGRATRLGVATFEGTKRAPELLISFDDDDDASSVLAAVALMSAPGIAWVLDYTIASEVSDINPVFSSSKL